MIMLTFRRCQSTSILFSCDFEYINFYKCVKIVPAICYTLLYLMNYDICWLLMLIDGNSSIFFSFFMPFLHFDLISKTNIMVIC